MKRLFLIITILLLPNICFGQAFIHNGRSAPDKYTVSLFKGNTLREMSCKDLNGNLRARRSVNTTNATVSADYAKFGSTSIHSAGEGWGPSATSTDFDMSGATTFTVEMWVLPSSSQNEYYFIQQYDGGPTSYNALVDYGTGGFGAQLSNGGNVNCFLGDYTFTVGVWYHIAWVFSGGVMRGYVNGIEQGSGYTITGLVWGSNYPWTVNSGFVACVLYVSEVRVSKGIARYTSNFTPPTRGF